MGRGPDELDMNDFDLEELRELYQEIILDHSRRPQNAGTLEHPTHRADGLNPLCGDGLTLTLEVIDGTIANARHVSHGCAISTASASLMTSAVIGQSVDDAETLFEAFRALVTEGTEPPPELDLGPLEVLAGVAEFPMRVKCATLPWHTLYHALQQDGVTATTEEGSET
jgi:nitrogen fixation NifU-like protein